MSRWPNYISVLGAVFIAVALGRAAFGVVTGDAASAVVDSALVSLPGVVLWYVAYWLPGSDFDPELYPRVLAWCFGGIAAMFSFILLRAAHPGVDVGFTLGTQAIALALGSVGGLAIGIREAEAITRARKLEARNAELARRERELQRKNDHLDEFTSIVSHDLRNPLNVAEGRLALAREDGDSDNLAAVADAHDRMEALIDDLLSLARQGETVDEVEPVDVSLLAVDCWEGVDTKSATLDADEECVLLADELRLRQLLQNLLRNAVEHGSTDPASHARQDAVEHGSTGPENASRSEDPVEHATDDVTVTVGALDDGSGFYVEDDGPGIPEGEREDVLSRGYSGDADGTGFGLAIVARVAEAHGWTLSVGESESGGARFEFADVDAPA